MRDRAANGPLIAFGEIVAGDRMTASALDPSEVQGSISMRIHGGVGAPSRARSSMLSHLGGQIANLRAGDAALIVSELVTNSVLHAKVGPGQTLTIRFATLEDRLRITVTDPGSPLEPHLRPSDDRNPGGYGLKIVDELSSAWEVTRDDAGRTTVWCELLLNLPPLGSANQS
jgi:anti-sigma regulatory factor (Ser/Thr protein kinase)